MSVSPFSPLKDQSQMMAISARFGHNMFTVPFYQVSDLGTPVLFEMSKKDKSAIKFID